jgi:hypothetical protein
MIILPAAEPMAAHPLDAAHSEATRRRSRADDVERLFRSRPGQWIAVGELADVGGFCAWRTRVADVRRRFESAEHGSIEWNHDVSASAYRWVRVPRRATAPALAASQPRLF